MSLKSYVIQTSAKLHALAFTASLQCIPAIYNLLFLLYEHRSDDFFSVIKNFSPLRRYTPVWTAHTPNAFIIWINPTLQHAYACLQTGIPRQRCTKLLNSWRQPCCETYSTCFSEVIKHKLHKQKQKSFNTCTASLWPSNKLRCETNC